MGKVTLEEIRLAAERIKDLVQKTPLIHSEFLSSRFGADIWLKLESLQRTGSFKPRGAGNKIAKLASLGGEKVAQRGFVAASAGNHAQGVALAASQLGAVARVIMPRNASLSKQTATRWYGAEVELHGDTVEEALSRARDLEGEGMALVHPFDDPDVIAGQGTVGVEIVEEFGGVEEIWVPVGGGGLAGGIGVAAKGLKADVKLVGVESDSCPAMSAALKAGMPVEVEAGESVADGIRIAKVGDGPYEILSTHLDEVEVVEEAAIPEAVLTFAEHKKIVTEGAGAIPLAALRKRWEDDPSSIRGRKIVLVVSGGNLDSPLLGRILEKALVRTGRICHFTAEINDLPGSLAALFKIIAEEEGNVLDVLHLRDLPELPIGRARVRVKVETRGMDHSKALGKRLRDEGLTR